ncbi:MAG: M15 family metallopeptidase [Chitinophagales bacterium]
MQNNKLVYVYLVVFLLFIWLNILVHQSKNEKHQASVAQPEMTIASSNPLSEKAKDKKPQKEEKEPAKTPDDSLSMIVKNAFADANLVKMSDIDASLKMDLRYASDNNFMEKNVYGNLSDCYLQAEVARKLAKAQEFLREKYPKQSLLLLDCARPLSVQATMWDLVKGTEKHRYVAAPSATPLHCYGVAVDVTIADKNGKAIDMGTDYDYFGELAQPRYHQKYSKNGKLSARQLTNRIRLREVMKKAGFRAIETEWWHFNGFSKSEAKKRYRIVK